MIKLAFKVPEHVAADESTLHEEVVWQLRKYNHHNRTKHKLQSYVAGLSGDDFIFLKRTVIIKVI